MISLFATGDFIRVEVTAPDLWGFRLGLWVGCMLSQAKDRRYDVVGLIIDAEGHVHAVPVDQFVTDYRYDPEADIFVDQSAVARNARLSAEDVE